MADPTVLLVYEARRALAWSQQDLAKHFGVSRRTVQRWDAAGQKPVAQQLNVLAREVFARDQALAARLAAAAGTTLHDLGLLPPPEPVPAPPPPPPPSPPPFAPPLAHLVDSITCVAADAMKLTPDAVRPALLAAFARARDLRLAAEDVARALGGPEPEKNTGGSNTRR